MRQVAALPYRRIDTGGALVEVLLVTTLRSKRWIIPKGDVDDGMAPHLAAAKEAEEEGGVLGHIVATPIGQFRYEKQNDGTAIATVVDVFPLEVREELPRWPEMHLRERRWLPLDQASDTVCNSELAEVLRSFQP